MGDWVKINSKILDEISSALDVTDDVARIALAQSAAFYANVFFSLTPQEIKDKIKVDVIQASSDSYIVSVNHRGGEASTFDLPKRGVATFISADKLGTTTTTPTTFSKQGEEGVFFQKIGKQGRPSIEQYAQRIALTIVPQADAITAEFLVDQIAQQQKIEFEAHGVTVDTRVGKFRAPVGGYYDPISGKRYGGGQFVAGAGYFGG